MSQPQSDQPSEQPHRSDRADFNRIDLEGLVEQTDNLIAQFKYVAELTGELHVAVQGGASEDSEARSIRTVSRMLAAAESLNESAIDQLEECLTRECIEHDFKAKFGTVMHDLRNHLNKVSMGCQSLLRKSDDLESDTLRSTRRVLRFCRGLASRMTLYAKHVSRVIEADPAPAIAATPLKTNQDPADQEPLHVAIVDDDTAVAEDIEKHLTQAHGFTVELFRDGESLLQRMQDRAFDAVLLDVVLPGMNGDQVLQTILDTPKLANTPVLMISGILDPTMVLKCLEQGAVDYLPKPLELPVLDARIQSCRNKKRLREMEYRQHFNSELAAELYCDPEKLDERSAMITVLFCDIRRFSAITSKLATSEVVRWIRDSMTELSKCVFNCKGTLVDYAGDGLMAMWGAPVPQEQHASMALDAAFQMETTMRKLAKRWEPILGEPFRIGIGINSGEAHVGVIGTFPKFKYGPLGPAVNIASRVEGITKYLAPLLVTKQTQQLIDGRDDSVSRRLCDARLVNISEPVPVYECRRDVSEQTTKLFERYEAALAHFEQSEFEAAAETLGRLFADHSDDGPTRILLARTLDAMIADKPQLVWEAPSK